MESAERTIAAALKRATKRGYVLMLDFDGVLAPIVARPSTARMSARTRSLLAACARRGRVAVISGRALSDVRKRVGLPGIWYAGNHGAQWSMGKARGYERLSLKERSNLRLALKSFLVLSQRYPGVFVEDKKLTFSVHFRGLPRARLSAFKKDVRVIAREFGRTLDIDEGSEFVYNVRSRKGHTKGDAVRLVGKLAPRGTPIYIGDDTTDEDAFKALPRGITVRVGKRSRSAARYSVPSRTDVDTILALLAHL